MSRSFPISTLTDIATQAPPRVRAGPLPGLPLMLGVAAIALPTLYDVARDNWSTEQGAHGPIVLATGIWLMVRELRARPLAIHAGKGWLTALILVPLLVLYCLARISGIIEIEAFVMYGALITAAYSLWGSRVLKQVWFPLIYLCFVFPPPNTLFAMVTQPLKILISHSAVSILQHLNYPVASSGVMIEIGQYQMLVAAACAGLNSLISLSALGLFYTYIRHSSSFAYMAVLVCCILPIAVFANLVRVLLLLLITYHFGEAAGQGFFHELAGLTMFATALIGIFGLDWLGASLLARLAGRSGSHG